MKRVDTYFCKIEYWSGYDYEDRTSYCAIGASSYKEAVERIERRFPNITKLEIQDGILFDGFVFFDTEEEFRKAIDCEEEEENEDGRSE